MAWNGSSWGGDRSRSIGSGQSMDPAGLGTDQGQQGQVRAWIQLGWGQIKISRVRSRHGTSRVGDRSRSTGLGQVRSRHGTSRDGDRSTSAGSGQGMEQAGVGTYQGQQGQARACFGFIMIEKRIDDLWIRVCCQSCLITNAEGIHSNEHSSFSAWGQEQIVTCLLYWKVILCSLLPGVSWWFCFGNYSPWPPLSWGVYWNQLVCLSVPVSSPPYVTSLVCWRSIYNSEIFIFIKHVVAVAAYVRLASRSQAKISQQRIFRPLPSSVHSRTCAALTSFRPSPHLNSRLTSGKSRSTKCNHLPSQAGFYVWQRSQKKGEYSSQSVPINWRFSPPSLVSKWLYSDFGVAVGPVLTRWRTRVTGVHLLENRRGSFPSACTFAGGGTTTSAANNVGWMTVAWMLQTYALRCLWIMATRELGCARKIQAPETQEKSRCSIQKVAGSDGRQCWNPRSGKNLGYAREE